MTVQDFFVQVGHETSYSSSGNHNFFTIYVHCTCTSSSDLPKLLKDPSTSLEIKGLFSKKYDFSTNLKVGKDSTDFQR